MSYFPQTPGVRAQQHSHGPAFHVKGMNIICPDGKAHQILQYGKSFIKDDPIGRAIVQFICDEFNHIIAKEDVNINCLLLGKVKKNGIELPDDSAPGGFRWVKIQGYDERFKALRHKLLNKEIDDAGVPVIQPNSQENPGVKDKVAAFAKGKLNKMNEQIFSTESHTKRIEGMKDVFYYVAGIIKQSARAIAKLFQFKVHNKDPIAFENKKAAYNVLLEVRKDMLKIMDYHPPEIVGNKDVQPYLENGALTMKSCVMALNGLDNASFKDFMLNDPILKNTLNRLIGGIYLDFPPKRFSKRVHKEFMASFSRAVRAAGIRGVAISIQMDRFAEDIKKARGVNLPNVISTQLEIEGVTGKINEEAKNIDVAIGAQFLRAIDAKHYAAQIEYIERHTKDGGVRISGVRQDPVAQGMLINGREHTISMDGNDVDTVFRSGAFAVHDENKIGIAKLREQIDVLQNLREIHLKRGEDAAVKRIDLKIKETEEKIQRRTHLAVAQALPKICASIKKMAADETTLENAKKAGFLHVEQSLLSDQQSKELVMIQDMKGAMDYIRDNVVISFTGDKKQEGVIIKEDGKIHIILSKEGEVPEETFDIKTAFFTQGVNEYQSLGHAKRKTQLAYQDIINLEGLNALFRYAEDLQQQDHKDMKNLLRHFSVEVEKRGKDIIGVHDIANACKALRGGRGIVCKSGKDRTGTECSYQLTQSLAAKLGVHDEAAIVAMRDQLAQGISYAITGQNTGSDDGYAFNGGQYATLPEEWRLPRKLCRGNLAG